MLLWHRVWRRKFDVKAHQQRGDELGNLNPTQIY
jgi:hypothetical protein